MIERKPIMPERLRRISDGTFGFIPHRFLRDGFFASLTSDELALYLFLVLAADRNGISYYTYDRICSVLEMQLERYLSTRNSLIDKDLIAFDGIRFQLLSLPPKPLQPHSRLLRTEVELEEHDPATIHHILCDTLGLSGSDQ